MSNPGRTGNTRLLKIAGIVVFVTAVAASFVTSVADDSWMGYLIGILLVCAVAGVLLVLRRRRNTDDWDAEPGTYGDTIPRDRPHGDGTYYE